MYLLLIIYLFISIFFSFLCSILEAVLLSITPAYIASAESDNKKFAPELKGFKDNIDKPLSAILTLNTFAHTIGAAGVGAEAQNLWGDKYLSAISFVLTLIILFASEIIPKTIGATYWKRLAPISTKIIKSLIFILYPIVWLSQYLTQFFGGKGHGSVLSRADFSAMAKIGVNEGVFKEGESKIIQNLIRFEKICVKDIMTPRTVVYAADQNQTVDDFYKNDFKKTFSRIPVFEENKDHITGYVLKNEILSNIIDNTPNRKLNEIKREITTVKPSLPIPDLFQNFLENSSHIACVVDEYGGLAGIVTQEDVIETLLGLEITDESDKNQDMQKLARKQWEVRAKKYGLQIPEIEDNAK